MSKGDEMAFPVSTLAMGDEFTKGLTKRELFAAMAMQGMMSLRPREMMEDVGAGQTVGEWIASNCVNMADALLAELEKERG